MHTLEEAPEPVDQGEADSYAQWFYDRRDPFTHSGAYERAVAISFHCADEDRRVPSDGAKRFCSALVERDPAAADRVRVTTYDGLSHLDGARDDRPYTDALDWLARLLGVPRASPNNHQAKTSGGLVMLEEAAQPLPSVGDRCRPRPSAA